MTAVLDLEFPLIQRIAGYLPTLLERKFHQHFYKMKSFATFHVFLVGICRRYHERKKRSKKSDEADTENVIPKKRNNPNQRLQTENITKRGAKKKAVKKPIKLLVLPEVKLRGITAAEILGIAQNPWSGLQNVSPIQLPNQTNEQQSQSRFNLETSSVLVNVRANRRLRRAVSPRRLSYQESRENITSAIAASAFPSLSEENHSSDNDADDEICADNDHSVQTPSTAVSLKSVSNAHSSQSTEAGSSQTRNSRGRRKVRMSDETIEKCVDEICDFEQQASGAGSPSIIEPNSSCADNHSQNTEISHLSKVTKRKSDKSLEQAKRRRTVQFRESHSTRNTRSTRSKTSNVKLQPEKRVTRSTRSSRKMSERRETRLSNESVDALAQKMCNFESRSVSETSTAATISSNAISEVPNESRPKRSTKPRVGFEANESKHDQSSNRREKICLKGGKWRRTIFDLRKTRGTACK